MMRAKISLFFIFLSGSLYAIETENRDSIQNPTLIIRSDFMSQHLWRGYAICNVPSFEPSVELSSKYLKAGIWGALSADGKYFEVDTYFKLTYSSVSLGLYDYYCPGSISSKQSYFNFKQNDTKHTLDLHIEYEGDKTFPVKFMLATMIYGDDLNPKTNKNFYSTYLELACFSKVDKINLEYFMGFNLFESYYGNKPSIINTGIKSTGNIKFFKKKHINLHASIVSNPLTNRIYLVFGMGL